MKDERFVPAPAPGGCRLSTGGCRLGTAGRGGEALSASGAECTEWMHSGRSAAIRLRPVLAVCLALLLLFGLGAPVRAAAEYNWAAKSTKTPKPAGGGNAYDVIAQVNQVRAANGLPPYQVNGALMAAAQAHSQYQASSGSITHTGAGGSNASGRAAAAGYGGGAGISVVENIYGGMGATAGQAVQWWQGDGPHLSTMLHPKAVDAGAGVAVGSNGVVYYTLDVGYVTGGAANPGGSGTGSSPTRPPGTPAATTVAFYPVVMATAAADGSIVHKVQSGQTLWAIAVTYKVTLADLYALNGFNAATLIHPGQKILIRVATSTGPAAADAAQPVTTTLSAAASPVAGQAAAAAPLPRPTATPVVLALQPAPAQVAEVSAPGQAPAAASQAAPLRLDPLLLLISGMLMIGAALVIAGNLLKRRG